MTGMPSSDPLKLFRAMASWILVKEKTVDVGCSLPEQTTYSPLGSTSTPCGLLPQGSRYITPGAFAGSMIRTPLAVNVSPPAAAAAFSAAFQFTTAT